MKKLIALSLSVLMLLLCLASCDKTEGVESELPVESSSSGENSVESEVESSVDITSFLDDESEAFPDENVLVPENILYYEGIYSAITDCAVTTQGARERHTAIYIFNYLSQNEVSDDVYFAVGVNIINSDADIEEMFGFIAAPEAKLSYEIPYDDEETTFLVFDIVGYVNKSTLEAMHNNNKFGIELTWMSEEFMES